MYVSVVHFGYLRELSVEDLNFVRKLGRLHEPFAIVLLLKPAHEAFILYEASSGCGYLR